MDEPRGVHREPEHDGGEIGQQHRPQHAGPQVHERLLDAFLPPRPDGQDQHGRGEQPEDRPADIHARRAKMARHLIVQTCADRERALAAGTPTDQPTWADLGTDLVDAIAALWQAPVIRRT